MTNQRDEDLAVCLDCGAQVFDQERLYPVGCDDVVCMECAFRRGGRYDEKEGRWLVPPAVDDLLSSVESVGH
jgi:hypothetical protein